ncbi:adenosylmethionine decarboxylase [Melioribacter sp. OK-6-Me]|uniref:adenosylmethionine decarboxylase n=1 Tax=unclassified Melioribacter TaxID=2627329 RepID=UPI003ED97297
MNPLGTQHIAEFIDCDKTYLNNERKLKSFLKKSIEESGLHSVGIVSHKLESLGVPVIAIINESHIGLHSYPEAGHVSLDVFTCSDPNKHIKLIDYLRKALKPKKVRLGYLKRGNIIEFHEPDWIPSVSGYGFEVSYHASKILYSKNSKYQMIEIIENEHFGRMLFLDNELQISEYDADIYNRALVDPIRKSNIKINKAVILGGGDGGVLNELLKIKPRKVTLVDIDPKVIEVSSKYLLKISQKSFIDKNDEIVYQDALHYLKNNSGFDVVVYDLTMHPEAFSKIPREKFLDNFFNDIYKSMNPGGILTLQCCSHFDSETHALVDSILNKYYKGIKYYTVYIPSFCEKWIFASARK